MNKLTEIISKVLQKDYSAFYYTPPYYTDAKSYLFTDPCAISVFMKGDDIHDYLAGIDDLRKRYKYAVSIINYETGYLLEERLKNNEKLDEVNEPLMLFAFYEDAVVYNSDEIGYDGCAGMLSGSPVGVKDFCLNTDKQKYMDDIEAIKQHIAEGNTYQVNYTVKGKFNYQGAVDELFMRLVYNQSARYGALINLPGRYLISISPELFFKTEGDKITAKPMKGTIKRGMPPHTDSARRDELRGSSKDRAENIMIVDLLRNDIGKICGFDSVNVAKEYEIEKYESLYQMTSTVVGRLNEMKLSQIIKNIFPCGSITGAPKIRTMRIISELENEPRGTYTGGIGLLDGDNITYNVPIRTLHIDKENGNGEIGIGSGIVWDSEPEKEYDETLLKSNFLMKPDPYFELFESVLYEDGEYFLLDYHLARLRESADYLLFNYNEPAIRNELDILKEEFDDEKKYKVKLLLTKWGDIKTEFTAIEETTGRVDIYLSESRIDSGGKLQYFKTTNRKLYDDEYAGYKSKGYYDVLYLNEKGEPAECAITNIFIKVKGGWHTPPINTGILNGCYRQYLLDNYEDHKEHTLSLDDIKNADDIKVVNSVRKERFVSRIVSNGNIIWSYTVKGNKNV